MAQPVSANAARWIAENQGKHLCACGCGKPIPVIVNHYYLGKVAGFLKAHIHRKTLDEMFWDNVEKRGRCWIWTGYRDPGGYGRVTTGGRQMLAHRFCWELHNGPIPAGLCVLHRCDVRNCLAPFHLFIGTRADNVADMMAKGRNQHGEARKDAKLTDEAVRSIRRAYADGGVTQKELSARHGVVEKRINLIVRMKAWRHVV